MEITWGVPTAQRTVRQERFTFPVIILSPVKKKGSRKIEFNKASQELLGLIGGNSHIILGYAPKQIFINNLGVPEKDENGEFIDVHPNSFCLTQTCTFSDKKTFEYIAKVFELNTENENVLKLTSVENQPFVEIVRLEESEVSVAEEKLIDLNSTGNYVKEEKVVTLKQETPKEEVVEKVKETINGIPIPEAGPELRPERVKFAIDETDTDEWDTTPEPEEEIETVEGVEDVWDIDEPTTEETDEEDEW